MSMDEYLSSGEAARTLGLTDSRVRQLARQGRIPARKVGQRWLLEAGPLRAARPRPVGRPLSPSNAWALLFLASGEDAPRVDSRSRRRLMKRLRSLEREVARLGVRAESHWFRAPEPA